MEFTKGQLSELICKHTEKENGLHDLMEIMLESLMVSERSEYLREEGLTGNKRNGYRPGRTYGHGRTLTFRIPRDRYGNSHPRILAILRDQEECERLAGTLYTKVLTQEQVGGSIQRHLRGTLQQGEQIADAGLSAQGYDGMAGAVIGDLLSGGAYRLRAHQDPPKAECRYGSLLCGPGSEGGQDQGSARDLQQAHGKRPGLGRDAE